MAKHEEFENKVQELMALNMSEERAREAAAIELGLSDGDVIDVEEDEASE